MGKNLGVTSICTSETLVFENVLMFLKYFYHLRLTLQQNDSYIRNFQKSMHFLFLFWK